MCFLWHSSWTLLHRFMFFLFLFAFNRSLKTKWYFFKYIFLLLLLIFSSCYFHGNYYCNANTVIIRRKIKIVLFWQTHIFQCQRLKYNLKLYDYYFDQRIARMSSYDIAIPTLHKMKLINYCGGRVDIKNSKIEYKNDIDLPY